MQRYATEMGLFNVIIVIILTCLVVSVEIYALSYKFVKNRTEQSFYEFWVKRFFAITISSFLVMYMLIYAYGLNLHLTYMEIFKLTSAIFMPAAIAGAAIEMLKGKL